MTISAPVSVIIPFNQFHPSIERAINSVLSQSMKVSEIILVNDGGGELVDQKILQIIGFRNPSLFKLVTLDKNLGAGDARNAGWDMASGDYIAFLDSDDAWHPRKIEFQYSFMAENEDIFLSGHQHRQERESPNWLTYKLTMSAMKIKLYKIIFFNQFITPSIMIKNTQEFRFKKNQRYMEDFSLWLTILLKNKTIYRMDAQLACIFKDPFGDSGLSSNLLKMEIGELHTYMQACKLQPFLYPALFFLIPFSLIKFLRRLLLRFFKVFY
jgi:glycosyltransferase involved in cell wall biosynthesis